MSAPVISDRARADLYDIWAYTADHSADAADRLIEAGIAAITITRADAADHLLGRVISQMAKCSEIGAGDAQVSFGPRLEATLRFARWRKW